MASVRDVAVLVRYFMSTAVSIPPTITIRADSITPATGGDRTDLRPPGVPALITRRWRALPAQRPLFHCRSLAEPIMFASCGKPKRRKRARALHKAHSSPVNLPASSFNPASMRSATEPTQYCTPDLTEASSLCGCAGIDSRGQGMGGVSRLTATEEQRLTLTVLAGSRDRGEADRARAMLLTLAGWTSPRFAEAFGVREHTVRLWRSDFAGGGLDALKASVAPVPAPVKSETALRVVTPLLEQPVAGRRNWTIPRLRAEIEARAGVRISRSQLSNALRKKVPLAAAAAHAEGTPSRRRGRTGRP